MINIYICIPHIALENAAELIDNDSVAPFHCQKM